MLSLASKFEKEPNEYTNCYVAFIDILGFKCIIEDEDARYIKSCIYDEIRKHSSLFNTELYQSVLSLTTTKQLKTTIISDSIILSIPTNIEDSFETISIACLVLQRSFLNKEKPIFFRGAISQGKHFHHESIIFGEALVKSYLLEKEAKYPQIIIDDSIILTNLCKSEGLSGKFIEYNCKPRFYNYIKLDYVFSNMHKDFIQNVNSIYEKHNMLFQCNINKHLDNENIVEKYTWLLMQSKLVHEFMIN